MTNLEKLCEQARLQEAVTSGKEDYENDLKEYLREEHNFHLFESRMDEKGNEITPDSPVHNMAPLVRPLFKGERGYLFLAGLPGQCNLSYLPEEREGTFYLVLHEAEKTREFHKIIRHLTTDNLLNTKSILRYFLSGAIIGGTLFGGADLALLEDPGIGQVASDAALGVALGSMGSSGTLVGRDYFKAKRDTAKLMEVYYPLMKHSSKLYDADFLKNSVL